MNSSPRCDWLRLSLPPTKNEAINMAEHREGTRTWDLPLLFPGFQHFQYCYGQHSSPPPQPDKISWSNLWFCAEFQIQTKRMQYRTDIIRRLCRLSFLLLRVILFSSRRLGKLFFLFRTWRNSLKRTSHPCLSAPPWCCNIWFPVVVEVMDVKKT